MHYEYKFVRLGAGWTKVRRKARKSYQEVISEHAAHGWRLVQVFAPGVGRVGSSKYYEIILERPIEFAGDQGRLESRLRALESIVTDTKFQVSREIERL